MAETASLPPALDWPVYWFAKLERAVEDGDHQTAAEAQHQLERLGVTVQYRGWCRGGIRRWGVPDLPPCPVPADPPTSLEALRERIRAGLTVRDVARRYRVGEDKVRGWIGRGELRAVNTSATRCGKPRWVITPEALVEFERRRAGGPEPKARRRQRPPAAVDYYPD